MLCFAGDMMVSNHFNFSEWIRTCSFLLSVRGLKPVTFSISLMGVVFMAAVIRHKPLLCTLSNWFVFDLAAVAIADVPYSITGGLI